MPKGYVRLHPNEVTEVRGHGNVTAGATAKIRNTSRGGLQKIRYALPQDLTPYCKPPVYTFGISYVKGYRFNDGPSSLVSESSWLAV